MNPQQHQSGISVNRPVRISKIGNAVLRTALYMPALSAMRYNPAVAALVDRLKAQGRLKGKQIVIAAMRKLLVLCFGVLKTGKEFDRRWRWVNDPACHATAWRRSHGEHELERGRWSSPAARQGRALARGLEGRLPLQHHYVSVRVRVVGLIFLLPSNTVSTAIEPRCSWRCIPSLKGLFHLRI